MTENTTPESAEATEFEKGTWQGTLHQSAILLDRSKKGRERAGALLWKGATDAIGAWDSDGDPSGENLYSEAMAALGGPSRKGDASKIKTVALAVRNHGLDMVTFPTLAKAYAEAIRLTKTVQEQAAEDDAAEKTVEQIATDAPKSSSTPEGAALIVLAQGLDEAARLLLDALGKDSAVHRAFVRAVAQEVAGRVPKPEPKVAKATTKTPVTKSAKATVKTGKAKPTIKAKAEAAKALLAESEEAPSAKAAPIKGEKAKPVVKAKVRKPAEIPAPENTEPVKITKPKTVLAKPVRKN